MSKVYRYTVWIKGKDVLQTSDRLRKIKGYVEHDFEDVFEEDYDA